VIVMLLKFTHYESAVLGVVRKSMKTMTKSRWHVCPVVTTILLAHLTPLVNHYRNTIRHRRAPPTAPGGVGLARSQDPIKKIDQKIDRELCGIVALY